MANPFTVASAAYDAGLRSPVALAEATALAFAESGGNERAHSGDRYGLWMIPATADTPGEALYDVAANARAMYARSNGGTNWSPWSTFQGARYWLAYPPATAAVAAMLPTKGAQVIAQQATEPITDVTTAAVDAAGKLRAASAWLSDRNNMMRIAKVLVGGLLVVNGVSALAMVAGYGAYSKGAGLLARPIVKSLVGKGKQQ